MPQTSKWGNVELKTNKNQEHKEVEKAIFDKLYSLGPDAKDANVKRRRKMIAEGKTSYNATNEDNVSAPTCDQPHTSVAGEDPQETSAAAAASGTHDMLNLDSTESFFMSNEGSVELSYQVHLLTHAPEDETERWSPKSFWGEPGQIIVRDPIAQGKIALNCAQETHGFTDITDQVQSIEFPFEIRRVLKPRPFWVTVHNGPSGKFLGLYVKCEVDWNDNVATTTGEEYAEILSPIQNDGSFYSSASCFATAPPPQETKSAPASRPSHTDTKPSTPAPGSVGEKLTAEDYKALFMMLEKMNLAPADGQIHVDPSMMRVQQVKPTPPKYAARSKVWAEQEDANLNLPKTCLDFGDSVKNLGSSLQNMVRKSASKTEPTVDLTVGYENDSDLSEEAEGYNDF